MIDLKKEENNLLQVQECQILKTWDDIKTAINNKLKLGYTVYSSIMDAANCQIIIIYNLPKKENGNTKREAKKDMSGSA